MLKIEQHNTFSFQPWERGDKPALTTEVGEWYVEPHLTHECRNWMGNNPILKAQVFIFRSFEGWTEYALIGLNETILEVEKSWNNMATKIKATRLHYGFEREENPEDWVLFEKDKKHSSWEDWCHEKRGMRKLRSFGV